MWVLEKYWPYAEIILIGPKIKKNYWVIVKWLKALGIGQILGPIQNYNF